MLLDSSVSSSINKHSLFIWNHDHILQKITILTNTNNTIYKAWSCWYTVFYAARVLQTLINIQLCGLFVWYLYNIKFYACKDFILWSNTDELFCLCVQSDLICDRVLFTNGSSASFSQIFKTNFRFVFIYFTHYFWSISVCQQVRRNQSSCQSLFLHIVGRMHKVVSTYWPVFLFLFSNQLYIWNINSNE